MHRLSRKKNPAWREFELLVARIEQTLSGSDVVVTSPDRIRSRITGRKREVDASLRVHAGSAELLVTIECRKRQATQDVTWIEQLGSKRHAIGASRTIAVASTAFSRDAILAASHYDIDLRVLSDITDGELQRWILPNGVVHVYKCCEIVEQPEVLFLEQEGDDFKESLLTEGGHSVDSAVFEATDGQRLTLNDLWLRADDQLKIFETVPTDDKAHIRRLTLQMSDNLYLRTSAGRRRVHEVKLTLSLRWRHERILLNDAKVVVYRPAAPTDQMRPVVRVEFESKEAPSVNIRLGMLFEPNSSTANLSVEPLLKIK